MADGQKKSYSSNANNAAAATPAVESGGCPACAKAGLPILLVRPGLADAGYAAARQAPCQPLLDKHVAGPKLSFGGYVLRTLRAGYVMVFYENPHTAELKATKGWQAYQVSDGGYLSPYPLQVIEQAGQKTGDAFTCQRTAAYATAMLMVIPDPKNAGKVWMAYSDHPWSEPVREFYVANVAKRDARMTMIDAASSTCVRSIAMSERNILTLVADYDQSPPANHLLDTPYAPLAIGRDMVGTSGVRPESAADLMTQAQALIKSCKGQYTIEQLKIVSVPDAVGMTAETASARMTQCSSAKNWLFENGKESEQRPWRLQTAMSIEGLLKEIDHRNEAHKQALANLRQSGLAGKKVSRQEFDRMMKAGELPPGTFFQISGSIDARGEWMPDGNANSQTGTIVLQSDRGLDQSTARMKEKVLAKLGKDGKYPFRDFIKKYRDMVDADQKKLAKVELDHKAWIQSDARKLVTMHDCARTIPMDGLHFASIVRDVTNGGTMTENGLEWYAGFVHEDPAQADAILTQAMLGNQDAFFKTFTAKSTTKQVKNLLKVFEEAAKVADPAQLQRDQRLVKSFPFFDKTVAAAPVLKRVLDGIANPLATVSGGVLLGLMKRKQISQGAVEKFERLLASIADTVKPDKVFTAQIRFDLALAYWRTADRRVRMSASEQAAESTRQATANVQRVVENQTGKVKSLVLAGSLSMALQMPESLGRQMVTVWRVGGQVADDVKLWGKATADALRSGSPAFNAAAAVLQAISLAKLPEQLTYGTEQERQVAYAALIGSGMGLAAASLELGEAVYKEVEKARGIVGEAARARYLKLAAGRISAAATVIEAGIALINWYERGKTGDSDSQTLYLIQAAILSGAAYAAWMGATATFTMGSSAASAGVLGLSYTGWGLILVGLGLLVGYLALLLQDTPVEEWAAKCIWGIADSKNQWGNPQREQEELNKLLLGIKVELGYSTQWIKTLGASAAASEGWSPFGEKQRVLWKTAEIRLWIPKELRTKLHYGLTLALVGTDGVSTTVYSYLNGVGQQLARLPGLDDVKLDEHGEQVVLISVEMDGAQFRSAQAEILLAESNESRNVLVQQILND